VAVRANRSRRWGAAAAAVLVLAACSEPTDDGDATPAPTGQPATAAPPTPTPSAVGTTAPPAPAFEADDVEDLGALCGMRDRRYAGAIMYAGNAPHTIAVFSREVGSRGFERRYVFRDDRPAFDPKSPGEVALLACLTGVRTGKSVGRCRYRTDSGTRTVRVDAQRFTFEVFALGTGQRVARGSVAADFCPPTLITTRDGDIPSRMASTLNDEHLFRLLDRYVSRPAP